MSDTQPFLTSNCSYISIDSSLYLINGDDCLNQEMSEGNAEESAGGNTPKAVLPDKDLQLERETVIPKPDSESEEKSNKPTKNSKKTSVSSGDSQKNKRNVPSKKNQKLSSTINKEDGNLGLGGKRSSSFSLEDDCNASQELNGAVSSLSSKELAPLSLNGTRKASRGSTTDPQSLYARRRRERINERLRTLKSLVPNGTKVDISTMLEEAVQCVKFIQLQIKLLSSDDLWMYAPIAYNG